MLEKVRGRLVDVDGNPLREGDVVTFLDVVRTCGECWFCLVARAPTRRPHRRVYGITIGADEDLYGGWSELIYLEPSTKVLKRPRGLTPAEFAGGGGALPTALHAVELAEISFGWTVVIQGSGPVGFNALILSRCRGAGRTVVLGSPISRPELADELGADATLDISRLRHQEGIRRGSRWSGTEVSMLWSGSIPTVALFP